MNEPSLEAGVLGALDIDWSMLTGDGKPRAQERTEEQKRLSAYAAELYEDERFRALLEHLLNVTLRRIAFFSQIGVDPQSAYAQGVFREGQNSVVAMLLKLVAEGRKETHKDRTL